MSFFKSPSFKCLIVVLLILLVGCGANKNNSDQHNAPPPSEHSTIQQAMEERTSQKVIIEPLRITQESWRINDTQPEWDGEDFYRFIAYDSESNTVHVEVLVSNVVGEILNPNDFIRVEGEWLESENENAPVLWGDYVEIIDPVEEWDARPGDM